MKHHWTVEQRKFSNKNLKNQSCVSRIHTYRVNNISYLHYKEVNFLRCQNCDLLGVDNKEVYHGERVTEIRKQVFRLI